jgi:hypothetical protein
MRFVHTTLSLCLLFAPPSLLLPVAIALRTLLSCSVFTSRFLKSIFPFARFGHQTYNYGFNAIRAKTGSETPRMKIRGARSGRAARRFSQTMWVQSNRVYSVVATRSPRRAV